MKTWVWNLDLSKHEGQIYLLVKDFTGSFWGAKKNLFPQSTKYCYHFWLLGLFKI